MPLRKVLYVANPDKVALFLPNSMANCGAGIRVIEQDQEFSEGEKTHPDFGIVEKDLADSDVQDLKYRRKAVNIDDPGGVLLDTHPDDHITENPEE